MGLVQPRQPCDCVHRLSGLAAKPGGDDQASSFSRCVQTCVCPSRYRFAIVSFGRLGLLLRITLLGKRHTELPGIHSDRHRLQLQPGDRRCTPPRPVKLARSTKQARRPRLIRFCTLSHQSCIHAAPGHGRDAAAWYGARRASHGRVWDQASRTTFEKIRSRGIVANADSGSIPQTETKTLEVRLYRINYRLSLV